MVLIKVLDKVTNKYVNVKIDEDDLERLQKYKYIMDQHHTKPFREEKINGLMRRVFLARDVMGFKFGDKRIVSYKNGDIHDVRKANLIEGRTRTTEEAKATTGNFWPHSFKSLINFLDKRKGIDEETAVLFLLRALKVKYTRKRIDLFFTENDYDEYKNKNIQLVVMRVLNKYFEWGGQVTIVKDLTEQMQEKKKDKKEVKKEVIEEKKVTDITEVESYFQKYHEYSKSKLMDLILKYLPVEDLIEIIMEKGTTSKMALTVQFNRKI